MVFMKKTYTGNRHSGAIRPGPPDSWLLMGVDTRRHLHHHLGGWAGFFPLGPALASCLLVLMYDIPPVHRSLSIRADHLPDPLLARAGRGWAISSGAASSPPSLFAEIISRGGMFLPDLEGGLRAGLRLLHS